MENSSSVEHSFEKDNFDRGIVPAETAARIEREDENYKHTSTYAEVGSIDATAGQTVSNEGLAKNYAIEPEMYVEEPGDLTPKPPLYTIFFPIRMNTNPVSKAVINNVLAPC
ncbi:MAG: hypothetical protein AAGN15_09215 [Cyanobacteria bacterium J06581_3]